MAALPLPLLPVEGCEGDPLSEKHSDNDGAKLLAHSVVQDPSDVDDLRRQSRSLVLDFRQSGRRSDRAGLIVAGLLCLAGACGIAAVACHGRGAGRAYRQGSIVGLEAVKQLRQQPASTQQAREATSSADHGTLERKNATHQANVSSRAAFENATYAPFENATYAPAREALATTPEPVVVVAGLQQNMIRVDKTVGPTLFCFAVVLNGTAEPWLLAVQLHRGGAGIFGCHAWSVFSDVVLDLGRGPDGWVHTVAIPGQAAWQSTVPGSSEKVWHNTVVFERAWKRIFADGIYKANDWVVKVDPDTVFLPGILQRQLRQRASSDSDSDSFMKEIDPKHPSYLVNCRQWYSFQGPLEVFSRPAADIFFGGIDKCKAGLKWNLWGEDWFVEHCMEYLKVDKREGFGLLDDMYCKSEYDGKGHDYLQEYLDNGPTCIDGKAAYHPYKTTDDLRFCLEQAAGQE